MRRRLRRQNVDRACEAPADSCAAACRRSAPGAASRSVANTSPPMTARPSGAFCSPASPRPSAIGIMPMIIASAVISTGRNRVLPDLDHRIERRQRFVARAQVVGEGDHQDRVRHRDADRHDRAHQRHHVDRRAGSTSVQMMPSNAAGTAIMMMKGSIHDWNRIDQHRVDQDDRQHQAEAEQAERVLHDLVLAAQGNLGGRRQILLHLGDHLVDLGGDRSEVAPFDIGGDVDDALDRVVVDRVHRRSGPHAGDVTQARHRRAGQCRRQRLSDDRIDVVGAADWPGNSGCPRPLQLRRPACSTATV